MSTRNRILLALMLAAACLLPGRAQGPQPAQAPDLPPGAMQARARTACLECHDARIIAQQRLSREAWAKEVDKMVRWGAVLEAKDRDALVDYLSANFPPQKPPAPAERLSGRRRR